MIKKEFDALLADNELVAIRYTATWCVPCKRFAPHWEAASKQFDFPFIVVDVDVFETGVMSIPKAFLWKDKELLELKERTAVSLIKEISSHLE